MDVVVSWCLAALVLGTTLQEAAKAAPSEALTAAASQAVRSDPGEDAVATLCPASCFCEEEAEYATCVGDGQWAPPTLPPGLSRVELRGFLVPELEAEQLRRLPGLRELQLNQCNISTLVDDAFAVLPDLDRLDLSENRLAALGPASLRGLRALHHLDLSANQLSNLTQAFTHLPALQHLNLRDNRLTSLAKDTFRGLDRVQHVNLDANRIVAVEVAAFQHLTSLAVLVLSNNPLATLSTLDFFGSRLQYIDVSNIGITRVPQALTQFVRDLRLAKNSITEIHRGDLDSYPNLGLLVLDDNGLELLEEDALGRHECLGCLWLNGNKLQNIPLSLPPALKSLYVEENQITELREGDFGGLINLEQLLLQRNQIGSIATHAFRELSSLKTLDLQANHLTNLTGPIFSSLANLDTLDLSQNPILTLGGDALTGLTSVKVLQMSRVHSAAVAMPDVFFDPLKGLQILEMYGSPVLVGHLVNTTRMLHSLRGVRELNLMHNDLAALRPDFPAFFPKLQVAKLSGNAWRCEEPQQVLWMKAWMTHSPVHFYRSHNISHPESPFPSTSHPESPFPLYKPP
ncbi:Leucine-rich repeat-containing G-protein coupled receptor 4 [Chionoecetes opilio]|uniref:Leucine-rich repeat-containing G-protein coupled receptor 4 n=1 Tax=Chionoecetes opilio TaxID=41210 RepID=A0A8J4Y5K1_CHIOP|nr:Leucine-rich repeat-containing G-protein coupled receptor 4 [Chionoecetes opilio]